MGGFFDSLLAFLREMWEQVRPVVIIAQYERGVVLRLGRYSRTLDPGLHWLIPLFESVLSCNVVTQTMNLPSQSITTKDGKSIVVSGVTKYLVEDAKALLLDVWSARDAMNDVTLGAIQRVLSDRTWDEIRKGDCAKEITNAVRGEVKKWGVKVDRVTLSDLALVRSIRLLQDSTFKDTSAEGN